MIEGVRRAFVDTPHGQVHLREAGREHKDERTPLMCLHQSPASSLTYAEVLPALGRDRFAFAVDTPGFGESWRPEAQPTIADYAAWLAEVPNALGMERFDVVGYFTGAGIAAELALSLPQRVRRVVLIGPPVFTDAQREAFVRDAWPARPRPDGSHLVPEWMKVMTRYPDDIPFERRADAAAEFYRGGVNAIFGEIAVARNDLRAKIGGLTQPCLIVQPDDVHGLCEEAHALVQHSRLVRMPGVKGLGMFQVQPEQSAAVVTQFLDEVSP